MNTSSLVLLLLAAFMLPQASLADDDLRNKLARCAEIAGDLARLRCFDETVPGSLAEPPASIASSPAPDNRSDNRSDGRSDGRASVVEPVPLDDSVGKRAVDENDKQPTYVGKLLRCEEVGPSDKTVFYLEGGQAWRQTSSGRLRLRNCESDVEISKDWIGFKMYIESKKRTIRVARVR